MENKQFPDQEPDILHPESDLPEILPEAEEAPPVIQELSFEAPSLKIPELEPEEELTQMPALIPEEPAEETLPEAEALVFPEEEPAFVIAPVAEPVAQLPAEEETAPEVSFMERIPDVEENAPETVREAEESQSAEEASEDVDLSFLNDPAFAPAVQPQENTEDTNDQEYRDAPAADAPAEEPAKPRIDYGLATRKGRPKRKKGEGFFGLPNILATAVWIALVVAIGVTLGRMLWVCAADVLAFGRPDEKVTVTVYEADTMEDIIDKLHAGGLIRYKSLFSLYADISDAQEDIKPGIYDLNKRYDYHALVNFMSPSSTRQVVELTIPEGYTCRQIYALLEENRVCTSVDIAAYAADGELSDYWFLEGLDRGSEYALEGYLFPDTYQFYKNSTPREALEKMLDNFNNRFTEEMRAQIDSLNANVTDGSFTVQDVVIVASLIEKESAAPAESPTVASVIYNRLFNWEYPALLNIDASIVYAQGGNAETIDTSIDSPYNTYLHTGLTPTPIANPGLSSLKAALNPADSNYYFYVLNPGTGMHQFSTTQAEHDAWIDEFYD